MPADAYRLLTRWRVEGSCGEVADILGDPLELPRWWPSVYLSVEELAAADEAGVGRRVRLQTKGWLPYTLGWEFVVTESRYPCGFTLEASGDLDGRGVWTFEQDGQYVNVVYDWQVAARKPFVRALSPVLKPLFEANHRWAMAQGEASLTLELQRRRAVSSSVRAAVPLPPGPVTYKGVLLVATLAAAGAGLVFLIARRATRPRHRS